jgi:hypothetical protein
MPAWYAFCLCVPDMCVDTISNNTQVGCIGRGQPSSLQSPFSFCICCDVAILILVLPPPPPKVRSDTEELRAGILARRNVTVDAGGFASYYI